MIFFLISNINKVLNCVLHPSQHGRVTNYEYEIIQTDRCHESVALMYGVNSWRVCTQRYQSKFNKSFSVAYSDVFRL